MNILFLTMVSGLRNVSPSGSSRIQNNKHKTKDKIQNQSELDQAIVERDELVRRLDYVNARINFLSSSLTNHGKENIQYVKTSE